MVQNLAAYGEHGKTNTHNALPESVAEGPVLSSNFIFISWQNRGFMNVDNDNIKQVMMHYIVKCTERKLCDHSYVQYRFKMWKKNLFSNQFYFCRNHVLNTSATVPAVKGVKVAAAAFEPTYSLLETSTYLHDQTFLTLIPGPSPPVHQTAINAFFINFLFSSNSTFMFALFLFLILLWTSFDVSFAYLHLPYVVLSN